MPSPAHRTYLRRMGDIQWVQGNFRAPSLFPMTSEVMYSFRFALQMFLNVVCFPFLKKVESDSNIPKEKGSFCGIMSIALKRFISALNSGRETQTVWLT